MLANGSTSSPELQRAYANRVKEIQRAMFTTGIYDDSTPEAEQESLERAKTLANSMLKYQAFIQFVMPTGATVKYEYEVGPEGAAFLDPFKAKENDPEHNFLQILYLQMHTTKCWQKEMVIELQQ